MMKRFMQLTLVCAAWLALSGVASASLTTAGTWNGNVGMSVDGIGGNASPVGTVDANIPVGATILQAYLLSAGTPYPCTEQPHDACRLQRGRHYARR